MVIIVQGGAGKIENINKRKAPLIKACKEGYEILKNGGSAIDAVVRAVVELEDNPLFNAGTGATLNIEGEVELDASIMSSDLSAGAVACIKGVKNPILVAKKVMEETDHIMLVGEGATRFARLMGFTEFNPITQQRKTQLKKAMAELEQGAVPTYLPKIKKFIQEFGTVGACALDKNGKLASATSTGGMFMHLPGRVGDSPIIGAGTYANEFGAVSATGHGEWIMKLCLAKITCSAMEWSSPLVWSSSQESRTAQEAINLALEEADKHKCRCGLIGVDKHGNVGVGFNTPQMLWAYTEDGEIKHF